MAIKSLRGLEKNNRILFEVRQMNRQKEWNKIWNKKYTKYKGHKDLHVSAGYDDLTYAEWQKLTGFFINKLDIKSTDDVLEVGCGSGAFLNEIKEVGSLSGIDYADDAIDKIRNVMEGDFHVSEAAILPFENDSFDVIVSFGVFFYFDSFDYATKVIKEMLRTLKLGGKIFIGEVSDLDKKDVALKLRADSDEKRDKHRVSKRQADHLYYPLSYFIKTAENIGMDIEVIKQDIPELEFYYNAHYRFSVILTDKVNY